MRFVTCNEYMRITILPILGMFEIFYNKRLKSFLKCRNSESRKNKNASWSLPCASEEWLSPLLRTHSYSLSRHDCLQPLRAQWAGGLVTSGWPSFDRTWWASLVFPMWPLPRQGTWSDELDPMNRMRVWVACNESKNGLMWNRVDEIKSFRWIVRNGWDGMCWSGLDGKNISGKEWFGCDEMII